MEDIEIDALRIVLGSGLDFQRAPFLRAGRSVEVKHRTEVERTAGVASVVRFSDTCCPVEDIEIAALRIVLGSGLDLQRAPFLRVGRSVEVKHGPLTGVRGIVLEVKNRYRLVVSITLLQRSVSVEIDEALVQPLWSPAASAFSPLAGSL